MNKVKLQIARDMRKKLLAIQDIPKIMASDIIESEKNNKRKAKKITFKN